MSLLHQFSYDKAYVCPFRAHSAISSNSDRPPRQLLLDCCKNWSPGKISKTMLYLQTSRLNFRLSIRKSKQINLLLAILLGPLINRESTLLNIVKPDLLSQLRFYQYCWFLLRLLPFWLPIKKKIKSLIGSDPFQFKMGFKSFIRKEMIRTWDWSMACVFYVYFG